MTARHLTLVANLTVRVGRAGWLMEDRGEFLRHLIFAELPTGDCDKPSSVLD